MSVCISFMCLRVHVDLLQPLAARNNKALFVLFVVADLELYGRVVGEDEISDARVGIESQHELLHELVVTLRVVADTSGHVERQDHVSRLQTDVGARQTGHARRTEAVEAGYAVHARRPATDAAGALACGQRQ